ncbi:MULTISPECIES: TIGR03758 family integrating conjugative element protein [Pasteurellaceae]|jgi:integrating conjugative element protein, PFL_4701 family|uniref:TIGR03758 family integrating conjugative element protein n=1 Tax=Pasteurellaceae TaxID=712 RepID=UPI00066EC774|nr:TIGR03758 family integrating conjugative element protein [Haemophilus parainfluenzae]
MSDPTKSFEIVAGFTPGQLGILIGGITIAGFLLAGAWMFMSNYKGFTDEKMNTIDFGKYVIRFIVLFIIVLFLIRSGNYV